LPEGSDFQGSVSIPEPGPSAPALCFCSRPPWAFGFIVDVASLDEALDIAREFAAAKTGSTYEIRPIALYFPDQRKPAAE